MNPREIEVHIEELVLHGFASGTRLEIADAIERELRGMLLNEGLPAAWHDSPETIEAAPLRATAQSRPADTGAEIARAIHHGGAR